jgi:acyl dehydratase
MTEVVELSATPGSGSLLRRAALGPVRRAIVRRAAGGLPDTTLVLRDVAVDRERLSRYDKVCGFTLADQLPPTYPHILAFPLAMLLMSSDDFPFPVIGLVHVANRIEVVRPIDAGERLEFAVRAADLREHDRGRQFDVRATATVGDEVVWRGISTYLRKEPKPSSAKPHTPTEAPPATAIWRVGREIGQRYAEVSGDRNPIHTSRLGARAFGFARPIAHGMWTKARCLAALSGRLPAAFAVEVEFKLPILLPGTVAFGARPAAPAPAGGSASELVPSGGSALGSGWELDLRAARSGRPHLTGAISFR